MGQLEHDLKLRKKLDEQAKKQNESFKLRVAKHNLELQKQDNIFGSEQEIIEVIKFKSVHLQAEVNQALRAASKAGLGCANLKKREREKFD